MEIQHPVQRDKEAAEEKQKMNEGKRDVPQAKQQIQLNNPPTPHSASSSPSHEFSFTISLHPPTATKFADKTSKSSPPSFAIDLSPADEIFFHGHLLPLHLVSNLPVSPRTSTNSLDSFTLPIKEMFQDSNKGNDTTISTDEYSKESSVLEGNGRGKSKSFSLFGRSRERENQERDQRQKRKLKFDVSNVVKKYMRFVKPLFTFGNRRGNNQFLRQPQSLSGNLRVRSKKELRGMRGEFSAPASMATSPANSGLLVASGASTPTKSDSTMEELQAAIQAAIAHCKKSIAAEDQKIKVAA